MSSLTYLSKPPIQFAIRPKMQQSKNRHKWKYRGHPRRCDLNESAAMKKLWSTPEHDFGKCAQVIHLPNSSEMVSVGIVAIQLMASGPPVALTAFMGFHAPRLNSEPFVGGSGRLDKQAETS